MNRSLAWKREPPLISDLFAELQSRDRRAQKGADPRFARSEAAFDPPAHNELVLVMMPPPEPATPCDWWAQGLGTALSEVS